MQRASAAGFFAGLTGTGGGMRACRPTVQCNQDPVHRDGHFAIYITGEFRYTDSIQAFR